MSGSVSKLFGGRGLVLTHGDGPVRLGRAGTLLRRRLQRPRRGALRPTRTPRCWRPSKRPRQASGAAALATTRPCAKRWRTSSPRAWDATRQYFYATAAQRPSRALSSSPPRCARGANEIIAARRGFHGRSCGSLGLTFNPKYRAPFASFIHAAKHYAPEEIPEKITDATLAVFIEPVQGRGRRLPDTGGSRPRDNRSLPRARNVASSPTKCRPASDAAEASSHRTATASSPT